MKLSKVNSKYGAPMGRPHDHSNKDAKVRLFYVPLNSGGYDSGGAYWGIGQRLYAAVGDYFAYYTRAANREQAKAVLLDEFPDLKFFR